MRIALIGDLHFFRLWVPPWRLFNKRLLGLANLWWSRRYYFDHSLVPALIDRVRSIQPDLLLFSGDLTQTALGKEFADCKNALKPLFDQFPAIILPGNHDRYTHASQNRRVMERCLPGLVPEHFPVLRPLTPSWDLLLLDSAVARMLTARGVIGQRQLQDARQLLAARPDGRGLLVMCHYPFTMPPSQHDHAHHNLIDAGEVRNLLKTVNGPVLYLHGHIHRTWMWPVTEAGLEHVTDINAGAPCMTREPYTKGQGFWQIDLSDAPAPKSDLILHWMDPDEQEGLPSSKGKAGRPSPQPSPSEGRGGQAHPPSGATWRTESFV